MLYRLSINPFANQLLFAAHMNDQALDGLGKVRHGARCAFARTAIRHNLTQTLDHGANFSPRVPYGRVYCLGCAPEIPHRGGEPVFEIGIEAVLCLTGLEIEKSEHQRSGETE